MEYGATSDLGERTGFDTAAEVARLVAMPAAALDDEVRRVESQRRDAEARLALVAAVSSSASSS
ncbi:hypothetical protein [Ilumatobacter nonamiensis]|uniref:hypothetical protein n=1 Tax=Ilumatobacter nonamiensis TaxID=467093 RepID=UPI00034CBA80|nr:hypothetical protein [Ilumatobacter nonamiensis]